MNADEEIALRAKVRALQAPVDMMRREITGLAAEVRRLRGVLGDISTNCEDSELRLGAPSAQLVNALRRVVDYAWEAAREALR